MAEVVKQLLLCYIRDNGLGSGKKESLRFEQYNNNRCRCFRHDGCNFVRRERT